MRASGLDPGDQPLPPVSPYKWGSQGLPPLPAPEGLALASASANGSGDQQATPTNADDRNGSAIAVPSLNPAYGGPNNSVDYGAVDLGEGLHPVDPNPLSIIGQTLGNVASSAGAPAPVVRAATTTGDVLPYTLVGPGGLVSGAVGSAAYGAGAEAGHQLGVPDVPIIGNPVGALGGLIVPAAFDRAFSPDAAAIYKPKPGAEALPGVADAPYPFGPVGMPEGATLPPYANLDKNLGASPIPPAPPLTVEDAARGIGAKTPQEWAAVQGAQRAQELAALGHPPLPEGTIAPPPNPAWRLENQPWFQNAASSAGAGGEPEAGPVSPPAPTPEVGGYFRLDPRVPLLTEGQQGWVPDTGGFRYGNAGSPAVVETPGGLRIVPVTAPELTPSEAFTQRAPFTPEPAPGTAAPLALPPGRETPLALPSPPERLALPSAAGGWVPDGRGGFRQVTVNPADLPLQTPLTPGEIARGYLSPEAGAINARAAAARAYQDAFARANGGETPAAPHSEAYNQATSNLRDQGWTNVRDNIWQEPSGVNHAVNEDGSMQRLGPTGGSLEASAYADNNRGGGGQNGGHGGVTNGGGTGAETGGTGENTTPAPKGLDTNLWRNTLDLVDGLPKALLVGWHVVFGRQGIGYTTWHTGADVAGTILGRSKQRLAFPAFQNFGRALAHPDAVPEIERTLNAMPGITTGEAGKLASDFVKTQPSDYNPTVVRSLINKIPGLQRVAGASHVFMDSLRKVGYSNFYEDSQRLGLGQDNPNWYKDGWDAISHATGTLGSRETPAVANNIFLSPAYMVAQVKSILDPFIKSGGLVGQGGRPEAIKALIGLAGFGVVANAIGQYTGAQAFIGTKASDLTKTVGNYPGEALSNTIGVNPNIGKIVSIASNGAKTTVDPWAGYQALVKLFGNAYLDIKAGNPDALAAHTTAYLRGRFGPTTDVGVDLLFGRFLQSMNTQDIGMVKYLHTGDPKDITSGADWKGTPFSPKDLADPKVLNRIAPIGAAAIWSAAGGQLNDGKVTFSQPMRALLSVPSLFAVSSDTTQLRAGTNTKPLPPLPRAGFTQSPAGANAPAGTKPLPPLPKAATQPPFANPTPPPATRPLPPLPKAQPAPVASTPTSRPLAPLPSSQRSLYPQRQRQPRIFGAQ